MCIPLNRIDAFSTEDCQKILQNKYILFLGDSGELWIRIFFVIFFSRLNWMQFINVCLFFSYFKVTRGMYKDLVKILQTNNFLEESQLKSKGERVHENDKLLQGGQLGELSNNTNYTEVYFCLFCLLKLCIDRKNYLNP